MLKLCVFIYKYISKLLFLSMARRTIYKKKNKTIEMAK